MVVPVWCFHDNSATGDPVAKRFEFGGFFADMFFEWPPMAPCYER